MQVLGVHRGSGCLDHLQILKSRFFGRGCQSNAARFVLRFRLIQGKPGNWIESFPVGVAVLGGSDDSSSGDFWKVCWKGKCSQRNRPSTAPRKAAEEVRRILNLE